MELLAPAKINLFLQVIGRREDGYHELCSLMCCVRWFDRLTLDFGSQKTQLVCSSPNVPCDTNNLALKAVLVFNRILTQETALVPTPLTIHLAKRIPVGAGLGGGSSDAAAVLNGLNRYYGSAFETQRLITMALELGADVPFFIEAQPAIARGIGEKLTRFNGLSPMAVVLVYPGFAVSTAWVYKNLNLRLTNCEKKIRNFPFGNDDSDDFDVNRHLRNDLESVAITLHPVIASIKKELSALGAAGAMMTGSGSAVFGLFGDKQAAQEAAAALAGHAGWQVFATEIIC